MYVVVLTGSEGEEDVLVVVELVGDAELDLRDIVSASRQMPMVSLVSHEDWGSRKLTQLLSRPRLQPQMQSLLPLPPLSQCQHQLSERLEQCP